MQDDQATRGDAYQKQKVPLGELPGCLCSLSLRQNFHGGSVLTRPAQGGGNRYELLAVVVAVHDYRQKTDRHFDQVFGSVKHVASKGQRVARLEPVRIAAVPIGNLSSM